MYLCKVWPLLGFTLIELWKSIVHRPWPGVARGLFASNASENGDRSATRRFVTFIERVQAPWIQMTRVREIRNVTRKKVTFEGHLILSVTTRRSHRRSGLEAKLSREMEKWKRTCFCVRFAKDHCRSHSMQWEWVLTEIIELYIIIISNAATTCSSFSDASIRGFGGWCPQHCRRTWSCSRLQLCRLGLLTYSTLPHDSPRLRLFWKLVAELTTSQISFIHVRKFW